VIEQIQNIIEIELGIGNVKENDDFFDKLKFDKIAFFQVILSIETHFSICFTDEELERIRNINDCVKLIDAKTHA
jgi:acyl carrier protein